MALHDPLGWAYQLLKYKFRTYADFITIFVPSTQPLPEELAAPKSTKSHPDPVRVIL